MSDNEELEDQLADQQAEEDAGAGEGEEAEGGDEGAAGLVEGEADEEDEAEYQDSSEVSVLRRPSALSLPRPFVPRPRRSAQLACLSLSGGRGRRAK